MTREEILGAAILKTKTVAIADGSVTVTELCAEDYLSAINDDHAKTNGEYDGTAFNALLVARCVIDSEGKRIFSDEDADRLRKGSFNIYRKLIDAVNEINGLTETESKN